MRKCDSCGKLYQENKDVFCPHCGAVAQKQCTHGSSFDSGRYDRGEIYKNNNPQYQNTTYNYGGEPHAQRESSPYNKPENTFENKKNYENKIPKINLPDITKTFSGGKGKNAKSGGIIAFCIVIALNLVSGLLKANDRVVSSDYEIVSEQAEDTGEFYTVVDKATIEIVGTQGNLKTFTLEIDGMGFDDYISENVQNDIASGVMEREIISDETFVDMLICGFSKAIVNEESYDNALADAIYYTGEQVDGGCKYEFTYSFDYDEIVHIAGGVCFYLDNGLYINAELPFSAFSLSENGEITYYTSFADSETAWNTVFEECSNHQEINRDIYVNFDESVVAEGE